MQNRNVQSIWIIFSYRYKLDFRRVGFYPFQDTNLLNKRNRYLNSGSENSNEQPSVLRGSEDVTVNQLPAGFLDALLHVLVGVVLGDVPEIDVTINEDRLFMFIDTCLPQDGTVNFETLKP